MLDGFDAKFLINWDTDTVLEHEGGAAEPSQIKIINMLEHARAELCQA